MIKVKSGVIKSDDVIFNIDKDAEQKLNKLYVFEGSKPIEIPELHAGDIGAIAKLDKARTGDTLSTKQHRSVTARSKFHSIYLQTLPCKKQRGRG